MSKQASISSMDHGGRKRRTGTMRVVSARNRDPQLHWARRKFPSERKEGGMSDRSLIFNAKGAQLGYIEADRAFDLTGRERCRYARATGNLSELNNEKIVGYVSLDGTFAGLSWISDELFGKPSGEVHPGRLVARNQRLRHRPKRSDMQRPEKLTVSKPNDVSLRTATAPQPENPGEHSQPFAKIWWGPRNGLQYIRKSKGRRASSPPATYRWCAGSDQINPRK
jgi:hypothetical protein